MKRKPLTLRTNFSWTFLGNVLYAAAQWGMLTVIAKIGTPQMVGQFALGFAITAPLMMFTNLNLLAVLATDARGQYRFSDYLALRIITTSLALVSIVALISFADFGRGTALVILLVGVAKAWESGSDIFYGLFMQRERMDRIASSMIAKGTLSLAALSLGVYLTDSVAWGVAGMALAWAAVLVTYDIPNGAWVLGKESHEALFGPRSGRANVLFGPRSRWDIGTLAGLAWLALPLGCVMALVSLDVNIPRYFIQSYLGERELGIYAAMAYATIAGLVVVNALGQAASPRLSQYYAARQGAEFSLLLIKLMCVGVVLGVAGVLLTLVAGKEILTLLYGPEYAEYTSVFFWLMVGAGISYVASFVGYGVTAARYFSIQVPLFACTVCVTIAACLWLVPAAGLKGAALALLISAVVMLLGSLVIVAYAVRKISVS